MLITDEVFIQKRKRIEIGLNKPQALPESKIDEGAQLLLLNAQYAAAYTAFRDNAENLPESQIAEFMLEFNAQLQDFDNLITEYLKSL